jgi:hypothetical protein
MSDRYDVRPVDWEHGLELHITRNGEHFGVTQTHDADGTKEMGIVRDYIETVTGAPVPEDAVIRICACAGGEHGDCWHWYDGCCCHNTGPQPFGECPADGECSCKPEPAA